MSFAGLPVQVQECQCSFAGFTSAALQGCKCRNASELCRVASELCRVASAGAEMPVSFAGLSVHSLGLPESSARLPRRIEYCRTRFLIFN